ncbi:unnamed protein product [Phytomonas sp. EM1]|nr:unnamed protein product [Phytomonas sp. EM1]|eukprot:CCW63831.1 unnamed protein product [Phytomonas sp. isolate EM1]
MEQEQREAEVVLLDLRRRVRNKALEDERLEASLRAFDDALDLQSHELALAYQKDQDTIRRRFAELREKVRHLLHRSHRSPASRHTHTPRSKILH